MAVDSGELRVSDKLQEAQRQRGTPTETAESETNAVSNPLNSYPTEKQGMIRSYIQSVDKGIRGFVQRVKNGDSW